MKLFHLSHNDLDGYSAQLITDLFFDEKRYYNSNYGTEVSVKINTIFEEISTVGSRDEVLFLITDLNITQEECELVEKLSNRLVFLGKKVSVQLLDHHISGQKQAKKYPWYYLDHKRCATKITYDFFKKKFPSQKLPNELDTYVNAVNAYDIWLCENELFEFGKVLNRACSDTREINANLFAKDHFALKKHILTSSFTFFKDNRYIDYDDAIFSLKKEFFLRGKRDSIDNLTVNFILDLLNKNKENMTIEIMDKKGILTNSIGNVSILGNAFLRKNPDFDFFMDVNFNGNVSLRSEGEVDVSQMAQKLFNGGGHKNASGGRIQGFKDIYTYKGLRQKIEERFGS